MLFGISVADFVCKLDFHAMDSFALWVVFCFPLGSGYFSLDSGAARFLHATDSFVLRVLFGFSTANLMCKLDFHALDSFALGVQLELLLLAMCFESSICFK